MRPLLRYIVFFFLFWLVVFAVNRTAFLISVASFVENVSAAHFLYSLFSGWLLDLSTIGYIVALPALFAILYFLSGKRWLASASDFIVYVLIVLYCMISIGELCLYQEWTSKLTMQALLHFKHPAEVFQSSPPKLKFLFFSLTIVFSVIYIILYRKRFALKRVLIEREFFLRRKLMIGLVIFSSFFFLDFIMIRGGWKEIPISESDAYYSQNHILNDAAVNPAWSLVHNVKEYIFLQKENPYQFMKDEEAKRIMKEMFAVDKDTTEHFLTTDKPNIVFLILESYTSYTIPTFGGDSISMFVDSIAKAGISFTKCYSAAYVSDQGIPAILSSYPSTPRTAVINQISKSLNLPCINKDLKLRGYESGFLFGGQLNYGNIKSYLYNMKFDVIKERTDFPKELSEGKLGIHDRVMAPLVVREINKAKQPFFYSWFTISSHAPYDIPDPIIPLVAHRQNNYINTVVYTDKALRDFFTEANKQPWYSNTLFVMVADHSHASHRDFGVENKEYSQIPLIFFGDVIKKEYLGRKINNVASQLDVVPTVLKQIDLDTKEYSFGKDLFNPSAYYFAYFVYYYGTGFIDDECFISKNNEYAPLMGNTCNDPAHTEKLKRNREAFLQTAFEDYLGR